MDITYWEFMQKVSKIEDRFDLRLKIVHYAKVHGIKPVARHYQMTAGTVRKWLARYGLEKVIADLGSRHRFIPLGAWSYNADVETVHALIEPGFYDLENFDSRWDFFQRAWAYQIYFNAARKNGSKGYKTPWDILKEKLDKPNQALLIIPPVMSQALLLHFVREQKLANHRQGVYHVPW